ncbi:hypothetical protein F511_21349 [Dorcoceras hygrometricum]|uniref:Uncharacterized protein n=1 Tax=Dorcoceras hygrometricum TaxID=472368 RepID=A0A2Z7CGZ2_9LAMI|nr:hypothetical protein F511_21349 [Dorcoceras hygrometricum]
MEEDSFSERSNQLENMLRGDQLSVMNKPAGRTAQEQERTEQEQLYTRAVQEQMTREN